ncbi:MAG: sigma-70 family RNA polymerase sigma factor [Acidobacteriota bacterium]|nr:sigma-70 family RNA polymerase sigma factor [Blastocatellia bacterium]MDW8413613.1 sigma-70 family RNA polymerase sigma factor [Acidobacteriota bacterium]
MKGCAADWKMSEQVGRKLLHRIARRDEAALGEFYDRYAKLVYSLALNILNSPLDAEEVTIDVFLQIWRQAERYDTERGSITAWVLNIARSRAIDRRRALDSRQAVSETNIEHITRYISSVDGDQDSNLQVKEARTAIETALAELDDKQRRVIELAYFKGLSQSEIAKLLGEPLGTVKTRTRAAMQFLRERLKQYCR